jgi:hypothetical protein
LLEEVADVVDFCEGIKPSSEEVKAINHKLMGLLAGHGASAWSPPVGQLRPEGCKISQAIPSTTHPPGTVHSVVRPGYVRNSVFLRPPEVVVTTRGVEEKPAEDARPEEAPPAEVGVAAQHISKAAGEDAAAPQEQEDQDERYRD